MKIGFFEAGKPLLEVTQKWSEIVRTFNRLWERCTMYYVSYTMFKVVLEQWSITVGNIGLGHSLFHKSG